MPSTTGQITGELQTVLNAAALAPEPDRSFLRITGADATRWLNGMVTNSIQALGPGEGCYNFLLNAQGRIGGDCIIYRNSTAPEPAYLLSTDAAQAGVIAEILDRFIIMDDVELAPAEDLAHHLLLLGPSAAERLGQLYAAANLPAPSEFSTLRLLPPLPGPVQVTSPSPGAVPSFLLSAASPETLAALRQQLEALGTPVISPETLEALRVLEARPRYGVDIRNSGTAKDLPQETNQAHALHFAKGCYVGQEIVERIRSRGQVHRLFTAFRLDGTPPAIFPVPLEANGKAAGELTSAATVQTTDGPVSLALGYARREFLSPGPAVFTFPGGTAHLRSAGSLD